MYLSSIDKGNNVVEAHSDGNLMTTVFAQTELGIHLYIVYELGHMFDDVAVLLRLHLQELLNHHH